MFLWELFTDGDDEGLDPESMASMVQPEQFVGCAKPVDGDDLTARIRRSLLDGVTDDW